MFLLPGLIMEAYSSVEMARNPKVAGSNPVTVSRLSASRKGFCMASCRGASGRRDDASNPIS